MPFEFNVGMKGTCNTVEDFVEFDTALRELIARFITPNYVFFHASINCAAQEDLRAALDIRVLETRAIRGARERRNGII